MSIIGIPCISHPDQLLRLLDSIDVPWPVVVIDNSPTGAISEAVAGRDVMVIRPVANLGVAASWNLIIRSFPDESWWCIANADTVLGLGDLLRLEGSMAQRGWVGMNGDWRVFGISAECVDRVGWFDENFHPIFCEDCDYERRCTLADVSWGFVRGGATHVGSLSLYPDGADPGFRAQNARTYPENVAYYHRKWGGGMRGGETFTTPFDLELPLDYWRLDRRRLADLAWQ